MKPDATLQIIERIIPGVNRCYGQGSAALRQHILRYRFAAAYMRPGDRILDAACGCGYGSRILAEAGAEVVSVDRDAPSLEHGRKFYDHERIVWVGADLNRITQELESGPVLPESLHRVVSLETLEHLEQPGRALAWFRRCLRPDGLLICSVPIVPTTAFDSYHLHDFTRESFLSALEQNGFTPIDQLLQENCFLTVVACSGEHPDLECSAVCEQL
jgi:2-polyprenyl-3-methyl-5-hydroxy-6-metoxy-1,4-benzoquinol methylase